MSSSKIIINHEEKSLIVSKAYHKKASVFGSDEYIELRRAMIENKGYKIEIKSIDKKTYHGLSFSRMKEYIMTQPDSENRLIEFEVVKEIAKAKGGQYPLTKKWFLLTYPEFKENNVSMNESAAKVAEAKAEAERKLALIEKVS